MMRVHEPVRVDTAVPEGARPASGSCDGTQSVPAAAAWGVISRRDAQIYKGACILLIVLHNFFHWVEPTVRESAFVFRPGSGAGLWAALVAQPLEALNLLLSYFGHYGVAVFAFLSAYGLARSGRYEAPRMVPFLRGRVAKLLPTFVMAVLLFAVVTTITTGALPAWSVWRALAFKLTFLANFYPWQAMTLNGPWWFYSAIVQLYAAYVVLRALDRRYGSRALVAASVIGIAVTALFNPALMDAHLNLRTTFVSYLPHFALGIYLGTGRGLRLGTAVRLSILVLFVLGSFFEVLWYFSSISFVFSFLFVSEALRRTVPLRGVGGLLAYFGGVSMPLFACHGFLLRRQLADLAGEWAHPLASIALAAAFLAVATAVAHVLGIIDANVRGTRTAS